MVGAKKRYQQQLDEFKIRLTVATDADVELDQNELNVLEDAGISEIDYSLKDAVETALLGRLDLANSFDMIDDAVRKVMVGADNLRADLDLIGTANVPSRDKTDFSVLRFNKGLYSLGFDLDLPLDRKSERNAYRERLIQLEQRHRQYENDEDEVILDVRQAYRDLNEAAERYYIQKNSLELAQKRVESTSMLLLAGRLTARDLLESQDALIVSENSVTGALVSHAIAKLSFFRDVSILQVRPDGMWKL